MESARFIIASSGVILCCLILVNFALASSPSSPIVRTTGSVMYPTANMRIFTADMIDSFPDNNNVNSIAKYLDLYVAWWWRDGPKVSQLHAIKPSIKVIVYRNVREIYSDAPEIQQAWNSNWILRDVNGNPITSTRYANPVQYLADVGSPGYQDFIANWLKNICDKYGFDGTWADFGLDPGVSHWGMTAHPVNPRTKQSYTDEEWVNDLITLTNKAKNALGSRLYLGNGIHNGAKWITYRTNYEKILTQSSMDGFMSEGIFTTNSRSSPWYSEADWKKGMDLLYWTQHSYLTRSTSKIYMAWGYSSSDQESRFKIASYLLGVDNFQQSYVSCSTRMMTDTVWRLSNVDVGTSTNDYYVIEGTRVYARDFTKVKVLVNPTATAYAVTLDASYRDIYGATVSSPLTVNPHTGIVLIKQI